MLFRFLGPEHLLHCRLGGECLIVRTDESLLLALTVGKTLHVTPHPDRLHWFNAAGGQRP